MPDNGQQIMSDDSMKRSCGTKAKGPLFNLQCPEQRYLGIVFDTLPQPAKVSGHISGSMEGTLLINSLKNSGVPESEVIYHTYLEEGEESSGPALMRFFERCKKENISHVLCMGEKALEAITDKQSLTKYRGSLLPVNNPLTNSTIAILPTLSISLLQHGQGPGGLPADSIINLDIKKLFKFFKENKARPLERAMLLNPTYNQIMDWLGDLKEGDELSVDIETERGIISCIGFAKSSTDALCIPFIGAEGASEWMWDMRTANIIWDKIKGILESGLYRIIGQNFSYDMAWLDEKKGIKVQGYYFDTLVAMAVAFPEYPQGLDFITSIFTDIPYYKDIGKGHRKIKDYEALWEYNCLDVLATFEAYEKISKVINHRGLEETFSYQMEATQTIYKISRRGILFDRSTRKLTKKSAKKDIDNLILEIQNIVGHDINPASGPQIMKYLYSDLGLKVINNKKTKRPSVDEEAVKKLKVKYPKVELFDPLLKFRSISKLFGTYYSIKTDSDSRVRSSFGWTETGRLKASSSPFFTGTNLQNQPKEIRNFYIADPNCEFIELDLSQAEARIVAWEAREDNYKKMFYAGGDIHTANAANIFNIPSGKVTKRERQLGKKVSHATNYGMGPYTLCDSIIKELGPDYAITRPEAKRFQENYFKAYPGIQRWQNSIRDQLRHTRTLSNCFGRTRIFQGRLDDKMYREAYAYTPQSTVPDYLNRRIIEWEKDWGDRIPILLTVHDSVLFSWPFDSGLGLQMLRKYFESSFIIKGEALTIPIDVQRGLNWGVMEEIEI